MSGRIGIAIGDVTGVGPEVTLKALAVEATLNDSRYLVIGDKARLQALNHKLGLNLPMAEGDSKSAGRFLFHDPLDDPLPASLEPGSPVAAKAALAYLREGADRCLKGELDALVTAP